MNLKKFQKLIEENPQTEVPNLQSTKIWRTVNIEDLPLHLFIDLERYFTESNYYKFCIIFVKKYFWQSVKVHNLFMIVSEYGRQKQLLIDSYQYVFNPPMYGEPSPETFGDEIRKEFVLEFGSYVVLTDLICQKQNTNHKVVEQWKLSEFLFWADYYSGQKIIENIK